MARLAVASSVLVLAALALLHVHIPVSAQQRYTVNSDTLGLIDRSFASEVDEYLRREPLYRYQYLPGGEHTDNIGVCGNTSYGCPSAGGFATRIASGVDDAVNYETCASHPNVANGNSNFKFCQRSVCPYNQTLLNGQCWCRSSSECPDDWICLSPPYASKKAADAYFWQSAQFVQPETIGTRPSVDAATGQVSIQRLFAPAPPPGWWMYKSPPQGMSEWPNSTFPYGKCYCNPDAAQTSCGEYSTCVNIGNDSATYTEVQWRKEQYQWRAFSPRIDDTVTPNEYIPGDVISASTMPSVLTLEESELDHSLNYALNRAFCLLNDEWINDPANPEFATNSNARQAFCGPGGAIKDQRLETGSWMVGDRSKYCYIAKVTRTRCAEFPEIDGAACIGAFDDVEYDYYPWQPSGTTDINSIMNEVFTSAFVNRFGASLIAKVFFYGPMAGYSLDKSDWARGRFVWSQVACVMFRTNRLTDSLLRVDLLPAEMQATLALTKGGGSATSDMPSCMQAVGTFALHAARLFTTTDLLDGNRMTTLRRQRVGTARDNLSCRLKDWATGSTLATWRNDTSVDSCMIGGNVCSFNIVNGVVRSVFPALANCYPGSFFKAAILEIQTAVAAGGVRYVVGSLVFDDLAALLGSALGVYNGGQCAVVAKSSTLQTQTDDWAAVDLINRAFSSLNSVVNYPLAQITDDTSFRYYRSLMDFENQFMAHLYFLNYCIGPSGASGYNLLNCRWWGKHSLQAVYNPRTAQLEVARRVTDSALLRQRELGRADGAVRESNYFPTCKCDPGRGGRTCEIDTCSRDTCGGNGQCLCTWRGADPLGDNMASYFSLYNVRPCVAGVDRTVDKFVLPPACLCNPKTGPSRNFTREEGSVAVRFRKYAPPCSPQRSVTLLPPETLPNNLELIDLTWKELYNALDDDTRYPTCVDLNVTLNMDRFVTRCSRTMRCLANSKCSVSVGDGVCTCGGGAFTAEDGSCENDANTVVCNAHGAFYTTAQGAPDCACESGWTSPAWLKQLPASTLQKQYLRGYRCSLPVINGGVCGETGEPSAPMATCKDPLSINSTLFVWDATRGYSKRKCAVGVNGVTCTAPTQGTCVPEPFGGTTCSCEQGWGGDDCSVMMCPLSPVNGLTCHGIGRCISGACVCPPSYLGSACEVFDAGCNNGLPNLGQLPL